MIWMAVRYCLTAPEIALTPIAAASAISPSPNMMPSPAAMPPKKPRSTALWIPSKFTGPKGIASSRPMIMPTGIIKGLGMSDTAAPHRHQRPGRARVQTTVDDEGWLGAGRSTACVPSTGERLGCKRASR